ncbi:MAG: MAPEG family protein [Gammaproteobacteria bacterium]|nr:MAPEG family protein [Gammaproteobacteria bacterium]MDH5628707.1 MAPEG family protein [Gammaproteobacteria bacterium]
MQVSENILFYPMFAHVVLTGLLYVLLTIVRAPSVWGIGSSKDGSNPMAHIEPKISANLSNQFEWPLFFYVICLILMLDGNEISTRAIFLAWLFIFGRIIHSTVHIFTNNIRLRGVVFTLNFLAVLFMWFNYFFE